MLENIIVGVFVAACVFMLIAALLPVIAEPGKDGWDDVK